MRIFMAQSTSATQVDGNDSVEGSSWLSGVSYGSHTLYVALLDQADSNNVLDTDHHTFTYQSGSGRARKVERVVRRVRILCTLLTLM
jgi:hypothetical protein